MLVVLALVSPVPAAAQGSPSGDAGPGASAPSPTPDPLPRPARGPSVRERGGRRSRGASTASGALMLFLLIGFMGYYVVKRLRR